MNRRRRSRSHTNTILAAILAGAVAWFCTGEGGLPVYAPPAPPPPAPPAPVVLSDESLHVARVVDGDTIVLRTLNGTRSVRLVGVDAPEVQGFRNEEPGGVDAKAWLTRELARETVRLEYDSAQPRVDKHKRSLAYVHRLSDGADLGELIIRNGHATAYKKFRYDRKERYRAAEGEARRERRGVWRDQ